MIFNGVCHAPAHHKRGFLVEPAKRHLDGVLDGECALAVGQGESLSTTHGRGAVVYARRAVRDLAAAAVFLLCVGIALGGALGRRMGKMRHGKKCGCS